MLREILSKRYERPFLIVIVILLAIIAMYNWIVSLLALIIFGGVYVLFRKNVLEGSREMNMFFNAISQSVDQASNYAVQNLPIGIAIIDEQSTLCWANSVFLDWVKNINESQDLQSVMPNLHTNKFWGKSGYFFEHIGEKYFRAVYKFLQIDDEQEYLILYFENITETEKQKLACFEAVPVFCDIEIDNLEEVSKGLTDVQRATLWTDVNNCLLDELTSIGGFVRSYSDENYICCLSHKALETLKANNFSFLEKIRSIHTVNLIPVTISMGVAVLSREVIEGGTSSFNDLADRARSGLDLALGRGGDQVAVYEEDGAVHFYGGKTQTVEKNTRVRARVVALAMRELIESSNNVLIMGHEREDYDSIGAAIGVARMVRRSAKEVHVVISHESAAVTRLEEQIKNTPEMADLLISPETAEILCNDKTLLFVVDVHRPDMTVDPRLLDMTSRRVVIDHHRRSSDFIKQPLLVYTEASSSSTSELVTELLQYYGEDIELSKLEATALYAGIVVDTKNFAVQTGVRTFDAAAYLRRSGADPAIVRELFCTDFETVKLKSRLLSQAQVLDDGIVMAICPRDVKNAQIVSAQLADMLVNIENVRAAFTLYDMSDDTIGVSARSTGEINVQLVMEALGGGGHRTVAGSQIKGRSMDDVKEAIMDAVREVTYKETEEK